MKKIVVAIFSLILPLYAFAEEDLMNRSVTVERDFNPTVEEAKKISPIPTKENLNVEQPEVTYSTWSSAENVDVKNSLALADKYKDKQSVDSKNGVARLGLGFYWQTLGEFYCPLVKGDKYLFDIDIKHLGVFGNVKLSDGTTPRAMEHNTALKLNFENQFRNCKLHTDAVASYNGFDYYGLSSVGKPINAMKDTVGTYTTAGFHIGLNSTNPSSAFEYEVEVGYNFFGRNFGIAEHNIVAEADLGGEVGEGKLGAEFEVNGNIMTEKNPGEEKMPSGCFIKITPYYIFERENWNLKIGANLFIMAEEHTKRPFTGSADIEGTFALVPERLYLNALIGGFFDENMYSHIIKENKWVAPSLFVEPTYSPIDVNLGIKANILKGLLFDAGVRYTYILDQYYFVNDTVDGGNFINTFHAEYDDTHKVTAQLGLYFNYVKGLDMSLKGKYNYWGTKNFERGWQRPAWEVNFDAKYTIKEKWRIGLSYNFLGGRYAKIQNESVKMKDVHDLNLTFSYQILDWFELFLEGRNLINIQADTYYGYTTMGINGLIGVTFRF